MKYLLLLFPLLSFGQVATINIDGKYINNAPSGRDWANIGVPTGFSVYEEQDTFLIDDSDQNKINYYNGANSTGWRISTESKFGPDESSCNCSWSGGAWDSLTVIFTNTKRFEWYGEKMSHHGIANVYFGEYGKPKELQSSVDTYSPDNLSLTLNWFVDDLDTSKIYKFFLIPTGSKNEASTGTSIVIHGFKLIKETTSTEPPIEPPPIVFREIDIVREGYFIVILDGVQHGNGHSEYDKAVEHAVNLLFSNPEGNVIIMAPKWRVELN
jgi:hypothetical protein